MSSATHLGRVVRFVELLAKSRNFNGNFSTFKVIGATPRSVRAEYTVLEEHTNALGTLHGGFTASAIDYLTTVALIIDENDPRPGVSLNLSVNYLKGVKVGEKVTFEGEVVRRGRTIAYTTCSLFNENGDLAVHGTHTKHLGN